MRRYLFLLLLLIWETAHAQAQSTTPTTAGTLGNSSSICTNSSGLLTTSGCSSGGTPGGSNTQLQYNNSGAFGGVSGATSNGTTVTLASPIVTGTGEYQGRIKFTGVISPTQLTADVNDYNPTGLATAGSIRLTSDATRTITGLTAGADGDFVTVFNVGSNNIVLSAENASSSAANRFALAGDITLQTNQSVRLSYDGTSSRWRALRSGAQLSVAQTWTAAQTYGSGLLVATSPKIATSLLDANGNTLLGVTATASAVNSANVANAATGNAPVLSAIGSDTNIGLTLTPKGTGVLTLNGPVVNPTNGAASTPAKKITGTWFTGGSATTTKPQLLVEPSGATSAAWSTSGTGLGVNAASGFAGNLMDLQVNGTSRFAIGLGLATLTPSTNATDVIRINNASGTRTLTLGMESSGAYATIWTGSASPGTTNYALQADATNLVINGPGAGNIYFRVQDTTNIFRFSSQGTTFAGDMPIRWIAASSTSGSTYYNDNSPQIGIGRNADGILEVNNGSLGTYRDVILRNLIPGASLATNMTNGFHNIPGAAGAPTGTPANTTGFPLYWDSTNLKLCAYTGGAWKCSSAFN